MRAAVPLLIAVTVLGCKKHGDDAASVPSGRVLCWGLDQEGQLGAREDRAIQVPPAGADATALLAFDSTTCARGTGGWTCWGATAHAARELLALTDVVAIRAADRHACALHTTGTVECTGEDAQRVAFEAAKVPDPATSRRLYEVRTDSGGNTQVKPVGDAPVPPAVEVPKLVTLPNLGDAVEIALGHDHGCARRKTGEVVCWGASKYGQIGNGTADEGVTYGTPQPVADISDATAIAAGGVYSCAVRAGGSVWCWGSLHSTLTRPEPQPRPVQIAGITGATMVAITTDWMGDGQRACAVIADGRATCWTATQQAAPIDGVTGITQVVAGMSHFCARLATGQVACWGDDHSGEISAGGTGTSPVIAGLDHVAEVAVGARHSCARRAP